MADNQTHLNAQYDPGASLFGFAGAYASTGAAGSEGDTAAQTAGAVIGSPVVSTPLASSQVPGNMSRLPVTSGDTSGMSSDTPIGSHFGELSGDSQADLSVTGAGLGSAGHAPHPGSRP